MECIPCGDPPPPYEPHCKHSYLLPLKANTLEGISVLEEQIQWNHVFQVMTFFMALVLAII